MSANAGWFELVVPKCEGVGLVAAFGGLALSGFNQIPAGKISLGGAALFVISAGAEMVHTSITNHRQPPVQNQVLGESLLPDSSNPPLSPGS